MLHHSLKLSSSFAKRAYSFRNGKPIKRIVDRVEKAKTGKHSPVEAFMKELESAVQKSTLPGKDSQSNRVIIQLCHEAEMESGPLSLQKLRKIKHLIRQGKIKPTTIQHALKSAQWQEMVNVLGPRKTTLLKQRPGHKIRDEGQLNIHPSSSKEFNKILDKVGGESTETPLVERNDIPSTSKNSASHQKVDNIDLGTLESFLVEAEKQKREQKQFAWQQERRYQWNQAGTPNTMTLGSMLFQGNNAPRRSRFSKLFKTTDLGAKSTANAKTAFAATTQLLLYDLKTDISEISYWKNQRNTLHIEYKDLFTVINGSNRPPEQLLKIINSLEDQGWQLIGDACIDDSSKLVLKRDSKGSYQTGTGLSKLMTMSLLTVIVGCSAYGAVQRTKRKAAVG